MSYYGSWEIDDNLTFTVTTHNAATGASQDADSNPAYRVYEDQTDTPILTGFMSLLDPSGTVGLYSAQIALTAANGFEVNKSYNIYVEGVVNTVQAATFHNFQLKVPAAGTGDWTATERENIRDALGVTGTKSAATGGQLQNKSEFDHTTDQTIVATNNDKAGYSISGTKTTLDALNDFDPATDTVDTVTNITNSVNANPVTLAAVVHTGAVIPTVTNITNVVLANLTQILGSALTEVTGGRLAGNFGFFYRNNDGQTTKVVEDVGGGAGGGTDWTDPEKEQIRDALGVNGTKTVATGGQLQNKSEFDESTDTVTVGVNNDKTGYELTSAERISIGNAVWVSTNRTLTSFGTLVTDIWNHGTRALTDKVNFALTTAEHINIADALLTRDWSAITGEAARSTLTALRFLRNRWTAPGGALTVYKEDDSTVSWTGTLDTNAAAEPITGVDPD